MMMLAFGEPASSSRLTPVVLVSVSVEQVHAGGSNVSIACHSSTLRSCDADNDA